MGRLGLGCSLPKPDGSELRIEHLRTDDNELRKRILGKRKRAEIGTGWAGHHGVSKPRPLRAKADENAEGQSGDEDEPGRSAIGKASRMAGESKSYQESVPQGDSVDPREQASQRADGKFTQTVSPAKVATFLDESLAVKAQRQKRKKRKKRGKQTIPSKVSHDET